MITNKLKLFLFLVFIPVFTFSQEVLENDEKFLVIERIKEQIDSKYVFVEKADRINNAFDSIQSSGKYGQINDYQNFADKLTEDLISITKDKHFKVQYNPKLIQSRRARRERMKQPQENQKDDEEDIDWNYWYAQKENFGLTKIEILDGNIGYIKSNFWQPLNWVKSTFDAALNFVAHTDALIIDLSENQGGYSPSDSYLGSYFFSRDSVLWISGFNRPTGETSSVFTFNRLGGKRYLNKPIFILISEKTFSLAEQFAYCMKHFGKAIIIGQTSAGAAHAIDFVELNENYAIQIPISYSFHPITKTDWEGSGVIPHILTSKEEALKVAQLEAIKKLIESARKANFETLLKRYEKIKVKLNRY